ncbi:hypothetical protein, partial [Klebsiella pneumoniae]|uniref:hypothetical protein n=1 Tax=Klebsiella pneumoniae TaxID=573 RepID=UPI0024DE8327
SRFALILLHLIFRNNAGVMFCPFQLSADGYEMQFATNHLGLPFYLIHDDYFIYKRSFQNSRITFSFSKLLF